MRGRAIHCQLVIRPMPELPEVETMCRGVAAVAGCRIKSIEHPRTRLHPIAITPPLACFRRRVQGRRIAAVGRLGKRVVLELGGDGRPADRIVFEPRMTGLVLLRDPPDEEHLRLIVELRGRGPRRLLFWDSRGLGVVRLLGPAEFAACAAKSIGPDALQITAAELHASLGRSRRAVKVALLDQKAVAGVGNLYASELLHRARIHPATPCCRLSGQDWRRVHQAMRAVLQEAIRNQGSTLRDGTYRIGRNRPGQAQLYHRVYQRHGQPCLQCGQQLIVRIVQAQRSTFYCPRCQRLSRAGQ